MFPSQGCSYANISWKFVQNFFINPGDSNQQQTQRKWDKYVTKYLQRAVQFHSWISVGNTAMQKVSNQQSKDSDPMRSISVCSTSSAWRITRIMCSCSSNVSWLDRVNDPVSVVCIDQPVPNLSITHFICTCLIQFPIPTAVVMKKNLNWLVNILK